jgi:YspA, cpYpsA-related SLOG family
MIPIPLNGQTWLICGGRFFNDSTMFHDAMWELIEKFGLPSTVVHGSYTGADALADGWARRYALEVICVHAEWGKYETTLRRDLLGRRQKNPAGVIRNKKMIDEHRPNLVIAFPGGEGTANMVSQARAAGIDVVEVLERKGEANAATQ